MWKITVALVTQGFSDVVKLWGALLAAPFHVLADFIRQDEHGKGSHRHHTNAGAH